MRGIDVTASLLASHLQVELGPHHALRGPASLLEQRRVAEGIVPADNVPILWLVVHPLLLVVRGDVEHRLHPPLTALVLEQRVASDTPHQAGPLDDLSHRYHPVVLLRKAGSLNLCILVIEGVAHQKPGSGYTRTHAHTLHSTTPHA